MNFGLGSTLHTLVSSQTYHQSDHLLPPSQWFASLLRTFHPHHKSVWFPNPTLTNGKTAKRRQDSVSSRVVRAYTRLLPRGYLCSFETPKAEAFGNNSKMDLSINNRYNIRHLSYHSLHSTTWSCTLLPPQLPSTLSPDPSQIVTVFHCLEV